jgi:molecular chaperone GrpE (heat shock protein)
MSETKAAPKLQKWPFYFADVVLSGIAAYVLSRFGVIQGTTAVTISIACLAAAAWGAWLSITPWLTEYRAQSSFAENANLKGTLEQIEDLQKVGDLIRQANSHWQAVQDASGRTVQAAREIAERMKVETDEFMKFMENAHDQERAGLRLEVDKLRRMEGDWLKVAVQMLDHVYALFRAAERSGQEQLVSQLSQFQTACRDAARRIGLTPFVPAAGEKYDARGHQLANPPPMVDENATIGEVLAMGFTYQGQLLRRSLVSLSEERPEPSATVSVVPEEEKIILMERREEPPVFADAAQMTEEEMSGARIAALEASERAKRESTPGKPNAQDELPLV